MGRKRPNKPRRVKVPRQRGYTLRQLQPPGDNYLDWVAVPAGARLDQVTDPEIGPQDIDFLRRLTRIAPLYGNEVPTAGVYLDTVIDSGHLPVYHGEDSTSLVPLQQIVGVAPGLDEQGIRNSIHRLHAVGAFLMFSIKEHDMALVRFVSKKPAHPGEQWGFLDDKSVPAATICTPTSLFEDLSADIARAVMFFRSYKSQLQTPQPADLLHFGFAENLDQAHALWEQAHASGYIDYKGCDACPTGHLCTRDEE
ncbi:hypothetical protein [Streptomyces sp. bgisy126]|uniref:hypothetical protein n=1 Tax=unclassified Streptomyces TaxID=2593676 RepID=UPI003EB884FC